MKKIIAFLFVVLVISCKKSNNIVKPKPVAGNFFVSKMTYTAPMIGGELLFTYNTNNKITAIDLRNVGKITVAYNAESQISRITTTGLFPGSTDYAYTNGVLTTETRYRIEAVPGGGNSTSKQHFEYVWNSRKQPVTIKSYNNHNVLKGTGQVQYDAQGNPVKITTTQGIEYSYTYSNSDFKLFPGNEMIYTCLEDIMLTPSLSFTSPPDVNYYLPFTKEIISYTEANRQGAQRLVQFSYEKDGLGLIRKLTIKYGNETPIVYSFDYEKR